MLAGPSSQFKTFLVFFRPLDPIKSKIGKVSTTPSKINIFAQAARLNNQGVTALLEGDDKAALTPLTQFIKMMKQELSSKLPSNSDMKNEKSATLFQ
jgi:hypothetical protein